jgi:uncharacterized membrane protein
MDYQRNLKYFNNIVGLWLGCIIAGVILGMIFMGVTPVLGLLFIVAGIVGGLVLKGKSEITDAEIDRACANRIANIQRDALNKLGLDEDQIKVAEPVVVSGFNYPEDSMDVLFRVGKDGVWRSSEYEVTVFFFSEQQVHCFERKFSLIKDESFDSSDEYFYRDIVSVSTAQGKSKVTVGGNAASKLAAASGKQVKGVIVQTVSYEYFKLTTSGGTSIQAVFRKSDSSHVERSVAAMRNLLKAKKTAMV